MDKAARYVFISHSSKDIELTEAVCRYLESEGIACWYSERDLDLSSNKWSSELVKALSECKALIFLATANACASPQVHNEMTIALSKNKTIIPYMHEKIAIPPEIEYFVTSPEQIPAYQMESKDALAILLKKFTNKVKEGPLETVHVASRHLLQKEAQCFEGISNGSYGAGHNKCFKKNSDLGWRPSEIYIEDVIDEEFTFASVGHPEYDEMYRAFCNTPEYRKIERRGNNHERWMLSEVYQNKNLYLTLQRTRWSMLVFWWNQVRDNPEKQREMARYVFGEKGPLFPSSLCLHLILETADGLLVGTKISNNKKNDYGCTIAITVGEQLERSDFSESNINNNNFLYTWCRRACMEEIGFSNQEYANYVDENSIRILGITYEGDIHNFAVPLLLRLRLTFEGLVKYIKQSSMSPDEFNDIVAYTEQEALGILANATDEETQKIYHPSTFLRVLLYLAYKNPELLQG